MQVFIAVVTVFLLAVQAQATGSYRYGDNSTSVAVASSTPQTSHSATSQLPSSVSAASLPASSTHQLPTSQHTTATVHPAGIPAGPKHGTSHLPMSHHHETFSWSFNGTHTHPVPTGGSVTSCHSHPKPTHTHKSTHGSDKATGTGIPHTTPCTNSTSPHPKPTHGHATCIGMCPGEGANMPTGTGGLLPLPQIDPTPCPEESTKQSSAAPEHTESSVAHDAFTFPGLTISLPWKTVTLEPTTWSVPASPAPTTNEPVPEASEPAAITHGLQQNAAHKRDIEAPADYTTVTWPALTISDATTTIIYPQETLTVPDQTGEPAALTRGPEQGAHKRDNIEAPVDYTTVTWPPLTVSDATTTIIYPEETLTFEFTTVPGQTDEPAAFTRGSEQGAHKRDLAAESTHWTTITMTPETVTYPSTTATFTFGTTISFIDTIISQPSEEVCGPSSTSRPDDVVPTTLVTLTTTVSSQNPSPQSSHGHHETKPLQPKPVMTGAAMAGEQLVAGVTSTSSPYTLSCDSDICKTYCYCDQDGHVVCYYDAGHCASACHCVAK